MLQRPQHFRININAPLAKDLMFAGLGAHAGSTRYHDSSLYGNTGTLTNMDPATDWVWVPELGRLACDFLNTSTQYITTPLVHSEIVGTYTLSCWAKFNSTAVQGLFGTTNATSWGLYYRDSGQGVRMLCGQVTDSVGWTTATLYHICAIVGNTEFSVFIFRNGIDVTSPDGSDGASQSALSSTIAIGYAPSLTYPMNGIIGDPMIWKRCLSLCEIQQLADPSNVMLSGLILPPVRKWWPVTSGGAPTASTWLWARQHNSQVIGGGAL